MSGCAPEATTPRPARPVYNRLDDDGGPGGLCVGSIVELLLCFCRYWPPLWPSPSRPNAPVQTGHTTVAVAACTLIIESKGTTSHDRATAYRMRADAHRFRRDLDKAVADYSQSIALSRGAANRPALLNTLTLALNNRGYTFLHQTRFKLESDQDRNLINAAIRDFDEAILLNPRAAYSLANRAHARQILGDTGAGLKDIERAIQVAPNNGTPYLIRARHWSLQGEIDRAISDCTKAIELKFSLEVAYTRRGLLYERKGDYPRAKADYNAAIATPLRHDFGAREKELARKRLAAIAEMEREAARPKDDSQTARRIALVIGNSAYAAFAPLANPRRDAETIASTLRKIGFQTVTLKTDVTREQMLSALRAFASQAENADWAVIYFAGHGLEIGGINYLVPIDAKLESDRVVGYEAITLDQFMTAVEGARRLRLILLDACRDNPFARTMKRSLTTRSTAGGLAPIEPEAGTLVVYAAMHGQFALDGEGTNSPFASALVKNMTIPNLEIRIMFDLVRDDVLDMTARRQQPFSYGSLSGRQDFFFVTQSR